jgi:hypothetical protein
MVVTGTASGKSLAFNLPVLDAIARDAGARALYLYPTKALAQDQARALAQLHAPGARPAIYDGDTPTGERRQARRWANLILTNPDMLHVGVLPHHDRWGDVLANLRYVVVDEAHVYRGVFGSHVANVLRRLRRLARAYDSEPQFVLASATIANASQLAESLLGEPATVIDSDSAPRTERTIALWNPELIDAELGVRASSLGDASRLLSSFVEQGLRTICFAKSRKAVELIHRFASDRVDPKTAARLAPYRAGYTPAQRREIEQRLLDGLFRIILQDLREAWKAVTSVDFTIESMETEPQLLHLMAPNEAVVSIGIEVRIGEAVGMMNIAMPSIVIKMMRQKFDQQWSVRKTHASEGEQRRVLRVLRAGETIAVPISISRSAKLVQPVQLQVDIPPSLANAAKPYSDRTRRSCQTGSDAFCALAPTRMRNPPLGGFTARWNKVAYLLR